MCQFLSALALKNGDVLHHPMLDSHTDLVTYFTLPDTSAHHQHFAKVELTPVDWMDPSTWTFTLDEATVPGWWPDVATGVEERLRTLATRMILREGEHRLLVDGCWIVGGTAVVLDVRAGRIVHVGDSAQIHDVWGSAQIRDVVGSAQIHNVGGSAQIRGVGGSAQIHGVWGSAQIRGVWGSAQICGVGDSAQIHDVGDSAQIHDVWGSAQIRDVWGSAQIHGVRDSAQIHNVRGSAQICGVRGSAQIHDVRGSAQIHDVGGSAQLDVSARAHVVPR